MYYVMTKSHLVNFFVSNSYTPRPDTNSLVVNLTDLYEIVANTSEYPSIPKQGKSLFRSQ